MQKIIEASDRHQSHVELVLEIFQDDLPEQLRHLRPRESYTDEGYDSLRESCEPGTEMTQRELKSHPGEGPPGPSQSAWSVFPSVPTCSMLVENMALHAATQWEAVNFDGKTIQDTSIG